MELRIIPRHLAQSCMRRMYSAQAAPKQSAAATAAASPLPKEKSKLSKLPNGIVVASLENHSPVSRISVVVEAGARYEKNGNQGITHTLRNCTGLTTKDATVFGITRNIQQIGGSLSATSSREHISYNLECIRSHVDTGFKYLRQVSAQQVFKPWEIRDFLPRMQVELALLQQQPHVLLLELLHKAAFRNSGLGNSIYCPSFMLGKHSTEALNQFVRDTHVSSRMAVVGVGIGHDELKEFASNLKVESGSGAAKEPSKYSGGEVRVDSESPFTYVAVVGEGASLKNQKDVISAAILQSVMGTTPNVKRGNSAAKLMQAAQKATENPFAVSSLNINYGDNGLFGFYVVGQPNDMDKLVKAVVQQYNSVAKSGIPDAELKKAKQQVKAAIHMASEHSTDLAEELGIQAITTGKIVEGAEIDQLVDSVTASDVNTLAKKIVGGKASMAALGNLENTPYLDQLR